jgi:predicted ATP-dependent protease
LDNYQNIYYILFPEKILLPFDKKTGAAVIEYRMRLTGRQNRISTRFRDIADQTREASYWAHKDGRLHVTDAHVDKAYREQPKTDNQD